MIKKALTGIFALAVAGYANSSTTVYETHHFNFSSSHASRNVQTDVDNPYGFVSFTSSTGIKVTATALSSTGYTGTCDSGLECLPGNDSTDDDPYIQNAYIKQYNGNGLGAVNFDEADDVPNHAVDNKGNASNELDYDMVLFEFDTAVELVGVKNGWLGSRDDNNTANDNDTDISILGLNGPFTGSGNLKWSDLMSHGWGYHQDKFDIGLNTRATIAPGFESKYWLVGAYNSVFSGGINADNDWDAVKISKLITRTSSPQGQIPEPATFALMLAGVAAIFRRKLSA
ncbi:exosortase-dependent surface protein XDP1 [Aliiglaciecola litoralis]|uniref:Ice-binding protein C-terminal domain-containing protein n=1 Tax=Aliiglaciecola litoralis TaxID=582857 RepID=A0ABP3WWI8_9ALTE